MHGKSIVSSNCFLHFTSRYENLVSIVKNGFQPKYCLEKTSYFRDNRINDLEMAFPMVCFCDIPFSKIKPHIDNYGDYGIGLKKEWGFKKLLSPVIYAKSNSLTSELFDGFVNFSFTLEDLKINSQPYKNLISYLLMLTKPYEGFSYNTHKHDYTDYIKYYDEREWRHIPVFENGDEETIRMHLEKDEFLNDLDLRKRMHKLLAEKYSISFELNDIKYIILKNDGCKAKFLDRFRNFYRNAELEMLATKIITKDYIYEDT